MEDIIDPAIGINVSLQRGWLSEKERKQWWDCIINKVLWHRVKYKSYRFQTLCETPCFTTFYGGEPEYKPFVQIPEWLMPLVERASKYLLQNGRIYNAILVRLYFDGKDEIAWHTDGRKFLGSRPTIGSLSLGASATFEMRRMHNCWPCVSGASGASGASGVSATDNGVDRSIPIKSWKLGDGDLFAMRGETQEHWHHRVPKEKGRRPRININFRMILPNQRETEGGQKSYYKYMVHGDNKRPPQWTYHQLLRKHNSLLGMFSKSSNDDTKSSSSSSSISSSSSSSRSTTSSDSDSTGNSTTTTISSSSNNSDSSDNTTTTTNNNNTNSSDTNSSTTANTEWSCPKCTFLNQWSNAKCQICGYMHYEAPRKRSRSGSGVATTGIQSGRKKRQLKNNTILNMFGRKTT
jgi:hypothetical protein